ncbi:MAG: FHA domain-containing protein [Chloroflexi bacterium]|nr:FHA domain-containing protein [Chloroflexota bacterium]
MQGESVPIDGAEFVLGREPTNNWVIEDVEVSRRHARLIAQSGGYAIEDLGSTNGTFVNGQRIRSVLPLLPGATIRLGENVLLFFDAAPEPETARPAQTIQFDTEPKRSAPQEEATPDRSAESFERREPAKTPPSAQAGQPAQPTRMAEPPLELPFYRRPVVMAVGAVLILGACALTAFLWYVDANYLWCDVFGSLISVCAP